MVCIDTVFKQDISPSTQVFNGVYILQPKLCLLLWWESIKVNFKILFFSGGNIRALVLINISCLHDNILHPYDFLEYISYIQILDMMVGM